MPFDVAPAARPILSFVEMLLRNRDLRQDVCGIAASSSGSIHPKASKMQRRTFLTLSASAAASAAFPFKARATVPKLYSWDASPPMNDTAAFVRWMQENRREDPRYL